MQATLMIIAGSQSDIIVNNVPHPARLKAGWGAYPVLCTTARQSSPTGREMVAAAAAFVTTLSTAVALLAVPASAALVAPPSGRWAGELVGGAPSGHLGNPGHNVPLLGNGYLGLVLQSSPDGVGTHGYNFNGSTLELFLNSNANWDCEKSQAADALPPAVCSMRGLGGLTVNVRNSTAAGLALSGINTTTFVAEQRLANGSLWTERCGGGGSCLRSESIIHPEQNALLTTLSFDGPTAIELELQLWVLGRTSHVRPTANSSCTLSTSGVPSCSRHYNPPGQTSHLIWMRTLLLLPLSAAAGSNYGRQACTLPWIPAS